MDTETDTNTELEQLLQQAATVAAAAGVDLDAFMTVAWASYVDSRPGMRERIETAAALAQLAEARRLGKVYEA